MNRYISLLTAILLVSLIPACSQKNNAPVINGITMSPFDSIFASGTLELTADAVDEDDDDLTYAWSASGGSISAMTGQTIDWMAPVDTGHYMITLKVEDSEDSAMFYDTIKVYSALLTYSGQFTTPTAIYDNQLIAVGPITISGAPDDAPVDSILLTVDVTHGNPSYLVMYLVTPDDRYCTPWDGNYPGGQQSIMISGYAIPPLPANGDWTLYVGVNAGGGDGTVNSWSIVLYSHMTL